MTDSSSNNIYRNNLLDLIGMKREIVSASGHYLFDNAGNKITDFLAQYGAVPFGHSPEFLVNAVSDYLHGSGPAFVQPFQCASTTKLSKRLCDLAGDAYKFVVFTNSGAETVEVAIKLARIKTERAYILSTVNSFHGKTYSSLSATGSVKYREPNTVDEQHYQQIPFDDTEALEHALASKQYAAFIVEPVQGEGGMRVACPDYLQQAEALCKKYGTLFILDEIQTGIGRTGYLLASQKYNVHPDIILLSKALGGGIYPIGAAIVKNRSYSKTFDKKHSSTFANGGIASHVANAVLDEFEQNPSIIESIKEKEMYIKQRLEILAEKYAHCFSYSGTGLMYALRFRDEKTQNNYIVDYCQRQDMLSYIISGYLLAEKHILCMPFLGDANGAIRFEPALNIGLSLISEFINHIEEVCKIISYRRYDILMSYLIGRKLQPLKVQLALASDSINEPTFSIAQPSKGAHRFAFLIHSTGIDEVARVLPHAIRENYSMDEKRQLAQWIAEVGKIDPAPEIVSRVSVRSKTGKVVNGVLIFSPMSAEDMVKLKRNEKEELINDYLNICEKEAIDVVGLGAYTSVISHAGKNIKTDKFKITTGNSFTAMVTAAAIRHHMGATINNKNIMVIGARGSVGRLTMMDLSRYFANVFMVGSAQSSEKVLYDTIATSVVELIEADSESLPGSALARFKEAMVEHFSALDVAVDKLKSNGADAVIDIKNVFNEKGVIFPFEVSTSVQDFSMLSDCVISVTSSGKAFLRSDIFKPGTKVFDAARPFDIVRSENDGVEIYEGGLVDQPDRVMFGDCNMIGTRAGVNLACLSETILLTMEEVNRNFSIGKNIPYQEANEVFRIAKKHGFGPYLGEADYMIESSC